MKSEFHIRDSVVNQANQHGDNVQQATRAARHTTFWRMFVTWYGLVGATIGIVVSVLSWYALHLQYGWWFFGL